jgi:hypothetical protein
MELGLLKGIFLMNASLLLSNRKKIGAVAYRLILFGAFPSIAASVGT